MNDFLSAQTRWDAVVDRTSKHPHRNEIMTAYMAWRFGRHFSSMEEDYTVCTDTMESIFVKYDPPVDLSEMAADEYDAIMQAQEVMEQL